MLPYTLQRLDLWRWRESAMRGVAIVSDDPKLRPPAELFDLTGKLAVVTGGPRHRRGSVLGSCVGGC